jgi:SAM-dependent methyltransferase
MAQIVTAAGAVVGVDESPSFVQHANRQAQIRGLPQVTAIDGDVQQLPQLLAAHEPFDFAYARWVLCFVRDPEAVVRGIADRLRPGGRLVVHDYFNYGSMTMAPRRRSHDVVVQATMRSWRARGGDPDIAGRLPAMFAAHGLELTHLAVHQRIARGRDSMFAWPDTWWRTFAPKLVAMGEITQAECDEVIADLVAIRDGDGFVQCPPVYELIATRCS